MWIEAHLYGPSILLVGDDVPVVAEAYDVTNAASLTDVSGQSFNTVVFGNLPSAEAKQCLGLAAMLLSHAGHIVARFEEGTDASSAHKLLYPLFAVESIACREARVSLAGSLRQEPLARVDPHQRSRDLATTLQRALSELSGETDVLLDQLASALSLQSETATKLQKKERDLRRRTIELLESAENRVDFHAERELLEQQVRHAGLQVDKVKRTLSYQLGYELIHSTKSVKKLVSLPSALLAINQDATIRRKKRKGSSSGVRGLIDTARGYRKSARAKMRPQSRVRFTPPRRPPTRVSAPPEIESGATLSKLRVACIMDEFTLSSFEPECELLALRPASWRQQVEEFNPHILLVESAWRGHMDEWQGKIGHLAPELKELVSWCQGAEVPTAFWNKEDPVHFGTFLNTASVFDFVFTTDFDCIHRYKDLLGHDQVYLLPFACQPRLQNPIETFERKDAGCFAGAYYLRYPERQRDFLRIVVRLLERGPVEIFDRNHGKTDGSYQFPDSYREFIVGSLPFSEIDRAYKGYRYGININSIKYSQSMFARRVFELLASNTATVSNFSRGIRLMFGDLVISTDDPERLASQLEAIDQSDASMHRFRLAGIRKVLSEHTYQDRLAYIACKAFELEPLPLLPTIRVIASVGNLAEAAAVISAYQRQRYPHKTMTLLVGEMEAIALTDQSIRLCPLDSTSISDVADGADFVACFAPDDYYAAEYLSDLALATRYYQGDAIGKVAQYQWIDDKGPTLAKAGSQYHTAQSVAARASILAPSLFGSMTTQEFAERGCALQIANALSVDEFSYCHHGQAHEDDPRLREVSAAAQSGIDSGMSLAKLNDEASKVLPPTRHDAESRELGPEALKSLFSTGFEKSLTIEHSPEGILIESSLGDDERQYLYEDAEHPLHEFGFSKRVRFHLEVSLGLRIQAVFLFFDQARQRVGHEIHFAAMNHEFEVPRGAVFVRFGLLIAGPGTGEVKRLVLGPQMEQEPTRILGRHETLLLTNHYPSAKALYHNAFVHRRVLKYAEAGVGVDVFRHRLHEGLGYHEFEGVEVTTGSTSTLRRVLATNGYKTVLVHFLDEHMWAALKELLDDTKVIIWLHGAEVQPWHRRKFNYTEPEDLRQAKAASERRMVLWRSVFETRHVNLKIVFVSESFAADVMSDYGVTIEESRREVIHNLIDTDLFAYHGKGSDQRLQILSIRPFASRSYANDLSVQAIVELSTRPFFEELEFRLIGDGPLFDETVAPLRGFRNVLIEKRFLRQSEIAELHQDYGVFLCPSRMDSQGVSRDEAMASGLVPVTTRVAAVPEFVDEECGFLAPEEDASALASAIETLYDDPELFQRLSKNAAERVRGQSGPEQTVHRELALFAACESTFELATNPCQVDCEKD